MVRPAPSPFRVSRGDVAWRGRTLDAAAVRVEENRGPSVPLYARQGWHRARGAEVSSTRPAGPRRRTHLDEPDANRVRPDLILDSLMPDSVPQLAPEVGADIR